MRFFSDVVIAPNNKSAVYELRIEALHNDNKSKKVEFKSEVAVNEVFDSKGYFHIRKAHDLIIDPAFNELHKLTQKAA